MKRFVNFETAREACNLAVKNGNSNLAFSTENGLMQVVYDKATGDYKATGDVFDCMTWRAISDFLNYHADEEQITFVYPNCFIKVEDLGNGRSNVYFYDGQMKQLTHVLNAFGIPRHNVLKGWAKTWIEGFHNTNPQDAIYNDAKEIAEIAEDILNED